MDASLFIILAIIFSDAVAHMFIRSELKIICIEMTLHCQHCMGGMGDLEPVIDPHTHYPKRSFYLTSTHFSLSVLGTFSDQ